MIVKNIINKLPLPIVTFSIGLSFDIFAAIFSEGYNPPLPLVKLNQKPNHIKDIEIIINAFQRLFLVLIQYFGG